MKKLMKYYFEILLIIVFLLALRTLIPAQKYNVDTIKAELVRQEVKHPDIVIKQIILETGWLNCTHCALDNNNLFGFWWNKAYKKFDSWQEGISYYKIWQEKWYITGDYYAFLECIYKGSDGICKRYATDPLYVEKLQNIKI